MANTWRDIADSEVDPESPVTTSLAQAWRDNPEGIAGGASGAPSVVYAALALSNDINQGDIAASAIGQGELKTTTGSVSVSAGQAIRTMPGGKYSFVPEYNAVNNSGAASRMGGALSRLDTSVTDFLKPRDDAAGVDTGANLFVTLFAELSSSTAFFDNRYIQSSPPYDLGDGRCGLFIELDVRSDGSIGGVYVAPDPAWSNNGPTDLRPDWIDKNTGKAYKRIRRPAITREDVLAGRSDMADYVAALKEAPVEDVEITMAYKNADMDLFPHSWLTPPQGTIVMLDPVNTHDLLMLHDEGEDVAELMHKGYVHIGDEVKRKGPPGVVPVTFKWRNSR